MIVLSAEFAFNFQIFRESDLYCTYMHVSFLNVVLIVPYR